MSTHRRHRCGCESERDNRFCDRICYTAGIDHRRRQVVFDQRACSSSHDFQVAPAGNDGYIAERMQLAGYHAYEVRVLLSARPMHHVPEGEIKVPGGAGADCITVRVNRLDDRWLLHQIPSLEVR